MSKIDPSAHVPFHPGTPWGLFHFETPDVAAPAAAPDVDTAPPAADPEAGADAAGQPSAAAPAQAAPAWGPDSPEFQMMLDRAVEERLGGYAPADDGQGAGFGIELDPFSDNFGEQLVGTFAQLLDQALDQRLGPIQQHHEESLKSEGKQEAFGLLDSFAGELGEFDKEEAFNRAQGLFASYLEQYGPRYAEQFTTRALREAAQRQAQLERRIGERAVERYKEQLANAAGRQGGDLGVAGGGSRPPETGGSYDDVIRRWDARRHAPAVQL